MLKVVFFGVLVLVDMHQILDIYPEPPGSMNLDSWQLNYMDYPSGKPNGRVVVKQGDSSAVSSALEKLKDSKGVVIHGGMSVSNLIKFPALLQAFKESGVPLGIASPHSTENAGEDRDWDKKNRVSLQGPRCWAMMVWSFDSLSGHTKTSKVEFMTNPCELVNEYDDPDKKSRIKTTWTDGKDLPGCPRQCSSNSASDSGRAQQSDGNQDGSMGGVVAIVVCILAIAVWAAVVIRCKWYPLSLRRNSSKLEAPLTNAPASAPEANEQVNIEMPSVSAN